MKRKLVMILFLFTALVPAVAQQEKSHILISKFDGTVDTLLLNDVRDIYHSRVDKSGVEQRDISTLRLRTINSERVYPLNEIDYVIMPKSGRVISFMGTTQPSSSANAPKKTSVNGEFPGSEGDVFEYNWVKGDFIYLSTGDKSANVDISNGSTKGNFSFKSDSLVADQYIVYYSGTNSDAYNKVIVPTEQTQNVANNSDHIGASGDCGTATAVRQPNSDYKFALDHKTAVICFMPRVDTLETLVLKQVAVKADKDIAGTFTLSPSGLALNSGTGKDTITLHTRDFTLPHQKATAQDTVASYMVVAPQTEKTTMKVYYRVYDTRTELDTTVVKNVSINKIDGATVYPVTSVIPVRYFLAAITDGATWSFGEPATLYGSVNLPVKNVGLLWGYNRNLNFETKEEDIPLTHDTNLSFNTTPVNDVKQRAYYYRAYAKEGGKTYFGKVKKFGMDRDIVSMGTSVRWSSINMGAITSEDIGSYYAWGELEPKTDYSLANYQYYSANTYQDIGTDISGNPAYDVATAKWRSCWRMPTREELEELRTKCNWTWKVQDNQSGFLVANRNNQTDSTIFIPAAGYYEGTTLKGQTNGYYLSASQNNTTNANYLYFQNSWSTMGYNISKYFGSTIRPVFDSNIETEKGEYLFIRTDKINYSDDHTSTDMYGTMRGLDDVVTDITEGFVIGTTADVTLDSDDEVLKTTLTQSAPDNGSYHMPLSEVDMDKLELGTTYYVRAYLTYEGNTWYGDPLTMDAMTITTDSTNWEVGMTSARLCGNATGITSSVKEFVELGFVVGNRPDITIENGGRLLPSISDSEDKNGKFVSIFDNIPLEQCYYRAFIRQGGREFYGDPKMLGLEMVDLGLPSGLRWANVNIGSQTPMDNGEYYAWGETTARTSAFNANGYSYYQNNAYVNIGVDISGTTYDAAQVNWQSIWRMPTKDDMQELIDKCTWTAVTYNGKYGYKIVGPNGNSIFMPAAGYYSYNTLNQDNSRIIYWTSALDETTTGAVKAWDLDNYRSNKWYNDERWYGFPIRPVGRTNKSLDDLSMIQLTTDSVEWEVGQTSATLHGYLLGLRYHEKATESGFAYATTPNVTENTAGVQYLKTNEGETNRVASGAFSAVIPNVEDETVYYYRAYVKVDDKYYFADEYQFGRKTVDLGLSSGLLWSNINIGASSPDDGGNFYAWGEITTKNDYSKSSYTYNDYGKDISGSSHDVAHTEWGSLWRIPTQSDFQELIDQCTWTEINKYGRPMYKIVGPSGDSIFIAKRGYQNATSIAADGTRVALWTSILNNTVDISNENAYGANFIGTNRTIEDVNRYLGYAVRPVARYNKELADDTKFYLTTDSTNWQVGMTDVRLVGAVFGLENKDHVSAGFAVGYQSDIKIGDEHVTNVDASFSDDDNTFRGNITYNQDTTYYYRAYVKVGDQYYYGNARRYGLELVDMGNGIKWANINLGAQISSDYGNRYAWGEITTKSSYTQGTYKYYDNGYEDIGSDISGKQRFDVVKNEWIGSWRMPTVAEMRSLVENSTWTWTTEDGVAGYLVTSLETEKSIFLPAAGYQNTSYYEAIGAECFYWTSSLYNDGESYYLHGNATTFATDAAFARFFGLTVRPVTTAGADEGGGGDITGSHQQGNSEQTGGEGTGNGNAGTGNTGTTIGN